MRLHRVNTKVGLITPEHRLEKSMDSSLTKTDF